MFFRTSILRASGLTTNAVGPKTMRKLDKRNDRRIRWEGLRRVCNKDPEIYPMYVVTSIALAWFGWRFWESPTGLVSESRVALVENSEPWKDGENIAGRGKYKYHPFNDVRAPMKESPTALNVVVLPNVTLPKSLHDQYNKLGKSEFHSYTPENAAAPPNWKQDSKAQSRNALTGERPPSAIEPHE